MSRHHATIARSGPLWIVSDAESKNGIRVNGQPVREQALEPGDVLRLGDFVAVVVSVTTPTEIEIEAVTPPGLFEVERPMPTTVA